MSDQSTADEETIAIMPLGQKCIILVELPVDATSAAFKSKIAKTANLSKHLKNSPHPNLSHSHTILRKSLLTTLQGNQTKPDHPPHQTKMQFIITVLTNFALLISTLVSPTPTGSGALVTPAGKSYARGWCTFHLDLFSDKIMIP